MDVGGRHLPGYSSFDRIDQQYWNSRHFLAHHRCHCRKPWRKPLTASYSNGTRRQLLFHDARRHSAQRHRLCQWATDSASDGQGRLAPQSPGRSIGGGSSLVFRPLGLRNPDRSAPRLGGSCGALRGIGHQADAAAAGTARRLKGSRLKRASIRSFSSRMIFPGSKASARKPHETQCSMVVKPMHGMSKRMSC